MKPTKTATHNQERMKTEKQEAHKKNAAEVIKYPLSTEKTIRMMEAENRLIFVVDKKATKDEIKLAVQELYGAKIVSVKTAITKGLKKAYVKFSDETPAIDIATQLGMI